MPNDEYTLGLYKGRVKELEAELADWKASHQKAIESPCTDEQHCACVPEQAA